jgi:hypothetical protein
VSSGIEPLMIGSTWELIDDSELDVAVFCRERRGAMADTVRKNNFGQP